MIYNIAQKLDAYMTHLLSPYIAKLDAGIESLNDRMDTFTKSLDTGMERLEANMGRWIVLPICALPTAVLVTTIAAVILSAN